MSLNFSLCQLTRNSLAKFVSKLIFYLAWLYLWTGPSSHAWVQTRLVTNGNATLILPASHIVISQLDKLIGTTLGGEIDGYNYWAFLPLYEIKSHLIRSKQKKMCDCWAIWAVSLCSHFTQHDQSTWWLISHASTPQDPSNTLSRTGPSIWSTTAACNLQNPITKNSVLRFKHTNWARI